MSDTMNNDKYKSIDKLLSMLQASGKKYDVVVSTNDTEFKEYKVAFTTGHDEAVNIAFRNTGTANAFIDDVSVTLDTEGLSQGVIELVDFDTTLLKGKQIELFEYLNDEERARALYISIDIAPDRTYKGIFETLNEKLASILN